MHNRHQVPALDLCTRRNGRNTPEIRLPIRLLSKTLRSLSRVSSLLVTDFLLNSGAAVSTIKKHTHLII